MANRIQIIVTALACLLTGVVHGEVFVVKDGQPRAQIVTAAEPTRMASLAAQELQTYLHKISGARIPVTHEPNDELPIRIYVGRSAHTDAMGLTAEGLQFGAYRMKSGDNWLVLLGDDTDFVPGPWDAMQVSDRARIRQHWAEQTGEQWTEMVGSYMDRDYHAETGWWKHDRRGSLNAVYGWLRELGVRWYMPGELGEVVPTADTIALPNVDITEWPDFAMRSISVCNRYDWLPKQYILWYYRLGLSHTGEVIGHGPVGHGINFVHEHPDIREKHPEYFAVWDGKSARNYRGTGAPCLSSQGLLEHNVRYVRAVFDLYDEPMVSVMPVDNFEQMCECERCVGKGTPQRGRWGELSDYVWDYVNRVAIEVYKTHPDKKIICFAYDDHVLPPTRIKKLSPNLVVGIGLHGMRSTHNHLTARPQNYPDLDQLLEDWGKVHDFDVLITWDYYLYSDPRKDKWYGVPVFYPHAIAQNMRTLHDVGANILGDYIGSTMNMPKKWKLPEGREWGQRYTPHQPGYNHLNIYITSRLHWDVEQDIDALLDDYYRNYYGPAAKQMQQFISYCENNWPQMQHSAHDPIVVNHALKLLEAAQNVAGDSVYGERIQLLADYVAPLQDMRKNERDDTPLAVAANNSVSDLTLDGQLNDPFWSKADTYTLGDVATGARSDVATSFRAVWADNAVYFGIRCEEPDMQGIQVTATDDDDLSIFGGDVIELLIETQAHSYYQLTINPAGALVDLDRRVKVDAKWDSGANVAAHQGNGYWSIEMRIPVHGGGGAVDTINPLFGVIGRQPTTDDPWYFNLCRMRKRGEQSGATVFSPTGTTNFHVLQKFAKLATE